MMDSGWKSPFGLTLDKKNDQTALVWPFEARKPQKVTKELF